MISDKGSIMVLGQTNARNLSFLLGWTPSRPIQNGDGLGMVYGMRRTTYINMVWLVVSTHLKNISQLGWLFPIDGKIKVMFQTTNLNTFSILCVMRIIYHPCCDRSPSPKPPLIPSVRGIQLPARSPVDLGSHVLGSFGDRIMVVVICMHTYVCTYIHI